MFSQNGSVYVGHLGKSQRSQITEASTSTPKCFPARMMQSDNDAFEMVLAHVLGIITIPELSEADHIVHIVHRLSSKVNGSLCFPGLPRVVLRGNPSGFWRSSHRRHRPRVDDVRHLPAWRQIALKQIWGTRHCMLSEDESVNFLIHLISYHCKSW